MKLIYLPLRAFGDFVITASVVKDNFIKKVPLILPDHISDLVATLNGSNYFEVKKNIPYQTQPGFSELFKVKYRKNLKTVLFLKTLFVLLSSLLPYKGWFIRKKNINYAAF